MSSDFSIKSSLISTPSSSSEISTPSSSSEAPLSEEGKAASPIRPELAVSSSARVSSLDAKRVESLSALSFEDDDDSVESYPLIQEIKELDEFVTAALPSAARENRWPNPEINLLFEKYELVKKLADFSFDASHVAAKGLKLTDKLVKPGVGLGKMASPQHAPELDAVYQNFSLLKLTEQLGSQMATGAVLIYKKTVLDEMEKLADLNPHGEMSPDQIDELRDYIKGEEKRLASEAKKLVIKFGTSLPGYTLKAMSLLEVNAPVLKLGLIWVGGVLEPIFAGIEYRQAVKQVAVSHEKNEQVHREYFRHNPSVDENDTVSTSEDMPFTNKEAEANFRTKEELEDLKNDAGSDAKKVSETIKLEEIDDLKKAIFLKIQAEAKDVRDKRKETLLAKRDEYEDNFKTLKDSLLSDKRSAENSFFSAVRGFEREGLSLDPALTKVGKYALGSLDYKTAFDRLKTALNQDEVYENMLTRYIDVHSGQEMTDMVRNGLKTFAVKKQAVEKELALSNVTEAKVNLIVKTFFSVLSLTLTTLTVAGVIVSPLVALFVPTIGLMGVGSVLLTIALIKFHKKHPNLLAEYIKGTLAKITLYSLPKKIHELHKDILQFRLLKETTKTQIAARSITVGRMPEKAADREAKIQKLTAKAEAVQEKIDYWTKKIEPLEQRVAQAKMFDFLQETPKRVQFVQKSTSSGEEFIDSGIGEAEEIRANPATLYFSETITDSLEALKEQIGTDRIKANEEICEIVKARWGIDPIEASDEQTMKALWSFAP